MSNFSVGDRVCVDINKGHKTYRSPSAGNKIIIKNNIGHLSGNISSGDRIWVSGKYGFKSTSIVPVYITRQYFHGFGDYMWEYIQKVSSANRSELGIYIVKRDNFSDNLEVLESWHLEADDEYVTYNSGTYTYSQPPLTTWDIYVMADETSMYLIPRLGGGSCYSFNKNDGTYSVVGTYPVVSETSNYDGEYFYSVQIIVGGVGIYKINSSTLSIAASRFAPGSWIHPHHVVGDYVWSDYVAHGVLTRREKNNKSDLTYTGISHGPIVPEGYNYLSSHHPLTVGNTRDGSVLWFYGHPYSGILGVLGDDGWRKWDASTGAISDVITIDPDPS
jgi:hypothetical protein